MSLLLLLALSAASVFAQDETEPVEAKEAEATRPHVLVLKVCGVRGRRWVRGS